MSNAVPQLTSPAGGNPAFDAVVGSGPPPVVGETGQLSNLGGLFSALPPLEIGEDAPDASVHESVNSRGGAYGFHSTEVNVASAPLTTTAQQQQQQPVLLFAAPMPSMATMPQFVQPMYMPAPPHDASRSGPNSKSTTPSNRRAAAHLPRDPVAAAVFNARRAPPTYKSLFVTGLHERTEFTELEDVMKPFGGLISCRVLRDAKTGNSRRIGYINFESAESAQTALESLNGKPGPHGAPFQLQYADEDPSFKPEPTTRLFARFIPVDCTEQRLREVFSHFGTITELTMSRDLCRAAKKEIEPWNMAYISYSTTDEATRAIAGSDRQFLLSDQHHLVVKAAENPATKHKRQEWRNQAQHVLAAQAPQMMPTAVIATSPMAGHGQQGVLFTGFPPQPNGPPGTIRVATGPPQQMMAYAMPVRTGSQPPPYAPTATQGLTPVGGSAAPPPYSQLTPHGPPTGFAPQGTFAYSPPHQQAASQPQFAFQPQPPHQQAAAPGAQAPQGMYFAAPPSAQGAPQQFAYVPQGPPSAGQWQLHSPHPGMPHGMPQPMPTGSTPQYVYAAQPQQGPTYQHQPWGRAPSSPQHQAALNTQLPTFGAGAYSPHAIASAPRSVDVTHASGHFSMSSSQPPPQQQPMMVYDATPTAADAHAVGASPFFVRTADGQVVQLQAMATQ